MADLMDKIVSLAKRRGFVYPGSEIYGGLANSWDYGPLGVELKNNIKQEWWKRFVHGRDDIVTAMHKSLPPFLFYVVFELHSQGAIIPRVRQPPINFRTRIHEAATLRERNNFIHEIGHTINSEI